MKAIEPTFELVGDIDGDKILKHLEKAARTCYQTEEKIGEGTAEKLIRHIIEVGHMSILEHWSLSVRMIGSRAMSHQAVRHRLTVYSQESQRYCKYDDGFEVVVPPEITQNEKVMSVFEETIKLCVESYRLLLGAGIKPEDARFVIPNACKTEFVTTKNLRQWRHEFKQRCSRKAQWEIRSIYIQILILFKNIIPVVFEDFTIHVEGETETDFGKMWADTRLTVD